MTPTDGNVQDISVHDKEHPVLGPTEEEQNVDKLARVVVPMPQFTDPSNPNAASGSINFPLSTSPVEHSPDYGGGIEQGTHEAQLSSLVGGEDDAATAAAALSDKPREEWNKVDWQLHAKNLGLSHSGDKQTIMDRVTAHEDALAEVKDYNAGDWISEVDGASSPDDLDKIASLYQASEADFPTVNDAITAKRESLSGGGSDQ